MVVRSNGLTQTDRDYFNIVKTEDGLSDFLRLTPKNQKRRKNLKTMKITLKHLLRKKLNWKKVKVMKILILHFLIMTVLPMMI